ncbi:hypothetical protein GLOTRDRAFT_149064 [Gloeophyllum trabeum ATCC 11539]|uniref:Glycoside hydrolase family 3 N-terminal domain-containing protein n=1 Tax=Gloeophyllum trabeum (strain ATCC 11539 / FP-39264 / Madison 617) TaxID=670483 RepID=S7RSP9_GLOTA|nr:uncharacterized protein GLOTRDRAFT_149064 [Gloeophyllum trabeum ATCC 11539]EPQ56064.1 hypothetical protein GLOTRDRAFT_149064 [Gloeophyllum trabeum ATCC 11539]
MSPLDEEKRREIGQHFVFGFHGHDVSSDIERLIREYYVGNVILMKRNVQSLQQVRDLVAKLQKIAKDAGHSTPLMIGTDQENGLVSAFSAEMAGTQFPGAMAIAASQSTDLAEQVSLASAKELRLAGISWAYSPVCDVNSDPRNPVIGVRSFGDDPYEAAKYAAAVSRGLTSGGVAPSSKHFPGHGDTHVDSHLDLPRIYKIQEQLSATELIPFERLIKDEIATIMTGHMALPLIVGDDTPSSLSRMITTDLLRSKLGYKGVVVTDCLEMEAVAIKYGSEGGAVLSLQAGADIAMICHRIDRQVGALEATYRAINEGKLLMDDIVRSGDRIKQLKQKFTGSWEETFDRLGHLDLAVLSQMKEANAQLSRTAYAASTALMTQEKGTLPLAKDGLVLVFTPQVERINLAVDDADGVLRDKNGRLRNTAGPSYLAFARSVSDRVRADHIVYGPSTELPEGLKAASGIIFATRNAHTSVWQLEYLRRVRTAYSSLPMVLVTTCAPYDFMDARDLRSLPVLATFEFTVPALQAATEVIFGERLPTGRAPVSTHFLAN